MIRSVARLFDDWVNARRLRAGLGDVHFLRISDRYLFAVEVGVVSNKISIRVYKGFNNFIRACTERRFQSLATIRQLASERFLTPISSLRFPRVITIGLRRLINWYLSLSNNTSWTKLGVGTLEETLREISRRDEALTRETGNSSFLVSPPRFILFILPILIALLPTCLLPDFGTVF